MLEKTNTKLQFPPIHERPPFWVEYALALVGAYLVGIASILTVENWPIVREWLKWLAFGLGNILLQQGVAL